MGRKERQAVRERRKRRHDPPDGFFNTDPLICYDRHGGPATLKDIWRNCSAFLVCGGPSLKTLDLSILQERGVVSLAINNAAGFARTSAVTFSDPTLKFHPAIMHDPRIIKIVPDKRLRDRVRYRTADKRFYMTETKLRHLPNVWGYKRDCELEADKFLSRDSATWGRNNDGVAKLGGPKILFTFFLGLRVLHYFGVRQVFLLGSDFGMDASRGDRGNYAFGEKRDANAIKANNDIYRNACHYLVRIKPVLDAAGFAVYQCNPDSQLKAFPHVPFAEAREVCRNGIPAGDLDLSDWYDFKGEGYAPKSA